MQYDIKILSTALGAEVIGIDLKQNLTSNDIKEIFDLFYKHQVLVFRKQNLSPEEQITVCKKFGEIEMHPLQEVPWKYREITYVANINLEGDIFEHCGPTFELWHSDTCYLPLPVKMSFLYAEKVPAVGGTTLYANMYKAFDDLPDSIKQKIVGKHAVFGSSYKLMERCKKRGYDLYISEADMQPDVIHPIIRTHPVTHKKSIFVNWAHTDNIVDMDEQESSQLLEYIYQHSRNEQYVYTHHYQPGDMIVWDNASTLHSNDTIKLTTPRIMRRIMIKGTKPY